VVADAGPYRLLAVDDEPLALHLLERVAGDGKDIDVRIAASPRAALHIASSVDLDLVISDQRMPEMEGLAFLEQVRQVRPRARRILLTAYPDVDVALQAINEGLLHRFVLKPWDPEEMRKEIRDALEAKRLEDEHERLCARLCARFEEAVREEGLWICRQLSAGLGDELANAATPLLLYVGSLAGGGNDAERRATLAALRGAAVELEALIKKIKRGGRETPEAIECDLNQAVLSALDLLGYRFQSGIRLERELAPLPKVRCRAQEIVQAIRILLCNAADAVEGATLREVRVRTWQERGCVHVEVSDSGPGIDRAVRGRLFEAFTTTKFGRGAGLGLTVCRNIIKSHGGVISAESEPGKGARFTFALPAV